MFFLNNRPLFSTLLYVVYFIAGVHKCVSCGNHENIYPDMNSNIHDKIYSRSHMNNIHCFNMKNRSHFRYK